jgi:hypothetical protein
VDRAGELPVEPFPLLDRGKRHVDGAEPDRHRNEEGGWCNAGLAWARFDRKGGEVSREARKQGDF